MANDTPNTPGGSFGLNELLTNRLLQWGFAGLFAIASLAMGWTFLQHMREDREIFRDEVRRQQAVSDRQWDAVRALQSEQQRQGTELIRVGRGVEKIAEALSYKIQQEKRQ